MLPERLFNTESRTLFLLEISMNKAGKTIVTGALSSVEFALLTPKEAAQLLKVSLSWLAKARMRGDGPPYIQFGRAVRYTRQTLFQWMKLRQRVSTSDH
jgi:hypothetical protein